MPWLTQSFAVASAAQSWTAPARTTAIALDASGAWGGFIAGSGGGSPQPGARVRATFPVSPADVLSIFVGFTVGTDNPGGATDAVAGGGTGAGNGGGATYVKRNGALILVAGGGPGASNTGSGVDDATTVGAGPLSKGADGGPGGGGGGGGYPGGAGAAGSAGSAHGGRSYVDPSATDVTIESSGSRGALTLRYLQHDVPQMPTPLSPAGAGMVDRSAVKATWQHNQVDGDPQSEATVQYRVIGTGTWTTAVVSGSTASFTFPVLTTGVQYEWQVKTATTIAGYGPFCASAYFTADDPAAAPSVTSPVSGATIATNALTATWTVAAQTSYQLRIVGDAAGSADPTVIYVDSGEAVSTALTATVTAGVNHVAAHVQLRVRNKTNGVWSAWTDVPVSIEWAGPPKPRVTPALAGIFGHQIFVTVTNPAPVAVEPTADRIEVYVHENGIRERRAILAPGAGWIYETPPSGVEVGIEAVAIYTPTNVQTSSGVIY